MIGKYECRGCKRDDPCVLYHEGGVDAKPLACPYSPQSTTVNWVRIDKPDPKPSVPVDGIVERADEWLCWLSSGPGYQGAFRKVFRVIEAKIEAVRKLFRNHEERINSIQTTKKRNTRQINKVQGKVSTLERKIEELKKKNEELWEEGAALSQRVSTHIAGKKESTPEPPVELKPQPYDEVDSSLKALERQIEELAETQARVGQIESKVSWLEGFHQPKEDQPQPPQDRPVRADEGRVALDKDGHPLIPGSVMRSGRAGKAYLKEIRPGGLLNVIWLDEVGLGKSGSTHSSLVTWLFDLPVPGGDE